MSVALILGLGITTLSAQKKSKRKAVKTQETAAVVRSEATLLGNQFHTIPLDSAASTAILSVGQKNADQAFVRKFETYGKADNYQLNWRTSPEDRQSITDKLRHYRRVVVSITLPDWEVWNFRPYFANLNLDVPVVFVLFTSPKGLAALDNSLHRSAAILVGYTAETEVQEQMADALFGRAAVRGKLTEDAGRLYHAGDGGVLEQGTTPRIQPEDCGLHGHLMLRIDSLVQEGLAAGAFPGCQVVVLKDGKNIYDHCFGAYSDKDLRPVTSASIYDLGGISKSAGTVLAIMKLYDGGRLNLTDRLSQYLPWMKASPKKEITIRELLFNESGLTPHIRFYRETIDDASVYGPFTQKFVDKWHYTRMGEYTYACSDFKFKKGLMSPTHTPQHNRQVADGLWLADSYTAQVQKQILDSETYPKKFLDSDVDFILLQQVVEAIARKPMDEYLAEEFYVPMGLTHTLYRPLQRFTKPDIIPTACNDYLRRQDLCGYVLDEAAAIMGGVAGNAGLFSTAEEVGQLFQMLLNGGEWNGRRYLGESTCKVFTTGKSEISHYGMGFDRPNLEFLQASSCSPSTPAGTFGQMGFTGTCVWADPDNGLVYVFLSNRVCPEVWNAKLNEMKMRRSIQELIYESMKK